MQQSLWSKDGAIVRDTFQRDIRRALLDQATGSLWFSILSDTVDNQLTLQGQQQGIAAKAFPSVVPHEWMVVPTWKGIGCKSNAKYCSVFEPCCRDRVV